MSYKSCECHGFRGSWPNFQGSLLASVANLPQSKNLLEQLKLVYLKSRNTTRQVDELHQLQQKVKAAAEAESADVSVSEWKAVHDQLLLMEHRLKGKAELRYIGPIRLQWQSVALRLLSDHIQMELVPHLKLLASDLTNKVQVRDPPSTWRITLLRDALATPSSQQPRHSDGDEDASAGTATSHFPFAAHDFLVELKPPSCDFSIVSKAP